jgi:hypothetical protein
MRSQFPVFRASAILALGAVAVLRFGEWRATGEELTQGESQKQSAEIEQKPAYVTDMVESSGRDWTDEELAIMARVAIDPACSVPLVAASGSATGEVVAQFLFEGWLYMSGDNHSSEDLLQLPGECCQVGCDLLVWPVNHGIVRMRVDGPTSEPLHLPRSETAFVRVLSPNGRPLPEAHYWHAGGHAPETIQRATITDEHGLVEVQLEVGESSQLVFGADGLTPVEFPIPWPPTDDLYEVTLGVGELPYGISVASTGAGLEVSTVNRHIAPDIVVGSHIGGLSMFGLSLEPLEVLAPELLARGLFYYPELFDFFVESPEWASAGP